MAGFARWLREAKNLSQSDKSAAVCATPPHLEGALLSRLSKSKLCDDFEFNDQTRNAHVEAANKRTDNYDYNSIVVADDVKDKYFDKNLLRDEMVNYVDKQDGLDDDVYDEEMDLPSDEVLAISKAKVHLFDAWSDAQEVHLSWRVDPPGARYRCTGMTVAKGEALPKHVACHRAPPQSVVLQGLKIDPLEQYTFCIALEEMDETDTPVALVLGCAPAQPVRSRATYVTATAPTMASPVVTEVNPIRVSEVRSNVTSDGVLTVMISLLGYSDRYQIPLTRSQRITDSKYSPPVYNCYVVLAILSRGSLVAQKDTPCRQTLEVSMDGLVRGPYEVCATLSKKSEGVAPICVVPQLIEVNSMEVKASLKGLNTALIGVSLGLMVLVIGLVWFVRRILKKPPDIEQHRCYRQEPVVEESNRANYVMLTATSKV
ncbi:hypothetical protein EVAR_13245_1 [Eumeta japonica]|uniref:Uncharacterized protein n=1 Tax=Eumeta variegata TaxID=151549 RepID=A0A4C1TS90_EUMVA|nr:hypothetical protein EVAR_13245_1 [Eumeta japonica]